MIKKYQQQVEDLAKQLNCVLDQKPEFVLSAMMYVEEEPPRVEVPTITDQRNYLICLHEIGHVAHGHTQARPPFEHKRFYFNNGVLKSEAEAWNYALDNCLDDITDENKKFIWEVCLGSYYRDSLKMNGKPTRLLNGNRHHVEFVYDRPDQFFFETVKRLGTSIEED